MGKRRRERREIGRENGITEKKKNRREEEIGRRDVVERQARKREERREKEKEGKESKNLPLFLRTHEHVQESKGERTEKREKSGRCERGRSDFSLLSLFEIEGRERLPSFLSLFENKCS